MPTRRGRRGNCAARRFWSSSSSLHGSSRIVHPYPFAARTSRKASARETLQPVLSRQPINAKDLQPAARSSSAAREAMAFASLTTAWHGRERVFGSGSRKTVGMSCEKSFGGEVRSLHSMMQPMGFRMAKKSESGRAVRSRSISTTRHPSCLARAKTPAIFVICAPMWRSVMKRIVCMASCR